MFHKGLLKSLLAKGFDAEEADCSGVCIETSMVMDYNIHQCEGAAMMAATVGGFALQFGTLSHSHLNQVLKNIMAGVSYPQEELHQDVVLRSLCVDSQVSLARLLQHDPTFAQYCREGLLFEVLDEKMMQEEPDAAFFQKRFVGVHQTWVFVEKIFA